MATISTDDINRAALHSLRHYVSFSYYARSDEIMEARGGIAQVCICSGFVMRTRQIWSLVTAGHVLDEIDRERQAGIKLVSFRLWDGWTPSAKHRSYIPFDFDAAPKFRLNREGMDYGLFPLNQLLVENLTANGVVPIGEEHYEEKWPEDFDGYAMIGTPGRTVTLERHGERTTKLSQSICVIHLAAESHPPPELVKPFPRFYARILVPEDSQEWRTIGADIRGMSGGPVIGIRRDRNGVQYWVIGIQSGWLESQRTIAASHFQVFANYFGDMIDQSERI
jgi:hypothetical protein